MKNKSVCITGTFRAFSRGALEYLIKACGGRVKSCLTRDIDYLIVGKSFGDKVKKAIELNVPILNERQATLILLSDQDPRA